MARRTLLRSTSYGRLLGPAAEFLRSLGGQEAVVVASSRGAADDLARSCGRSLGVHRTTLTGLAVDLAELSLAREGLSPMSGLSAEAMAARVIHKLKGKLSYFRPVAETPGLARAVAATLAEMRLEGVRPEEIAATGEPGSDLARMAVLFDAELAGAAAADFSLLVRHAIRTARTGSHRLLGLPLVLLDVSLESALPRELMEAIAARSPAVWAGVLAGEQEAFERALAIESADADPPTGATLERVRRYLFVEAPPAAGVPDASLDYFSAAGESLECVEMARRIRRLAGDGVAFDRMAILLRSPERYQPLAEEALRRAGVPAYFSRGVARPDPAGRALLALLACAAEGCSATRFAEYLSLGQAPRIGADGGPGRPLPVPDDEVLARLYPEGAPEEEEAAEPEDEDAAVIAGTLQSPAAWEKLLVDAAVIGGRERWERRLGGLEAEYRLKLEGAEEGAREHLRREIERLGNLRRFALPLIHHLDSLPKQAPWGEWLERLGELAQAALRRPGTALSVLAELQPMADVGPVALDEVAGVLTDRLRFLRREPPQRRYGRVWVGAIEEARGRVFDVVFLPGLSEGMFPSRAHEDPILLDVYRRKLPQKVRMQDDRITAERRRLRIGCAAAGARLVFSYPRMDVVESRPRVPSFYALELVRAAHGGLPELRTFEEQARRAAPSRLDWPAPLEAREAIDVAEYDLAALGRTLSLPPAEARGAGHYLIRANQALVRSLRSRGRRWRNFWSGADGIFDPGEEVLRLLAGQRLAARAYSASALQHFAACPYRFLLHGIYQLRPREEAAALEQMDPATRGALFHRAQFQLLGALREAGLLPVTPENEAAVLDIADGVLDRAAGEFGERLAPAIPRVWRSEVEDLRTDFRGWIQHVAAADDGWVPAHFEYGFGLPLEDGHDAASTPEAAVLDEGARLRGSIDLVERHPERGTLRITDHKTGEFPKQRPAYVAGGAMLQPLGYALAAEKLLGSAAECGRLSFCTQRGGYQEVTCEVSAKTRQWFAHALRLIDREIERGSLLPAPQAGACANCDYRPVCGPHEERRAKLKTGDALEGVQELRNIP